MKYKIVLTIQFTLLLCGCANMMDTRKEEFAQSNETVFEKEIQKDEKNVGKYLFNIERGDCIEISGIDLINRKRAEGSIEITKDINIDFVIRRDDYGEGITMIICLGEFGVDMISYLHQSLAEGCGAKEDFYYQLSFYDFNNDGKKEVIVAAGNKKDILEVYIFRLDNKKLDENNPQLLTSIYGGIKAYVNSENEICVLDSRGRIDTYPYSG